MSAPLRDVLIVGGGPAGSAAAIQLAQSSPRIAARSLLLDKSVFPRDKPCGGGVVRRADVLLRALGVAPPVPSVSVDAVRLEYRGGSTLHRQPGLFRVVRRIEFDHALLQEAARGGVEVREGEAVRAVARGQDSIEVVSDRGSYRCRVLIGADGARSLIRRCLFPPTTQPRMVAIETVTRAAAADADRTAVLDFSIVDEGILGYRWDFPCLVDGRRRFNRGIAAMSRSPGTALKHRLGRRLAELGIGAEATRIVGASALGYDPRAVHGADRALLAGDALGTDSWLGEGISVALFTGMLAADSALEALETRDFSMAGHRQRILASTFGKLLRRHRAFARRFYRSAQQPDGLARWLSDPPGALS